jgi:hypothetical protein
VAQPYIPTDAARGAAYRDELGLASIEQARAVDHPFRGSHVRGVCFVCEQPQSSERHGTVHFIAHGEFACDPGDRLGLRIPLDRRTRHPQQANCPGCLAVLAAAAILGMSDPPRTVAE